MALRNFLVVGKPLVSISFPLSSIKPSPVLLRNFSTRLRERPAPITLTERAARRIGELLSSKTDAAGVRIGVKRRGCNGYSYTMNYSTDDEAKKNRDEVVNAHGVKVFVDPKAIFFVVGTEMDFIDTELASEFTFTNPNSKGKCGCGESFNV
jgi:iron-sulfur cluster assembly accessory protein